MEQVKFFSYDWVANDDDDGLVIDIYAIDENNKNLCIHIKDFTPYLYIELPNIIQWDDIKAKVFEDKLRKILGRNSTLQKCELKFKRKLYYANFTKDKKPILFPFLLCSFKTYKEVKFLTYTLKNSLFVSGLGKVNIKIHEDNANPILQLVCCKDIPTTGWISTFVEKIPEYEMITTCDYEFNSSYKNLKKVENNVLATPLIMGFDIEVYSSNPSKMPDPNKPEDKVFQISCVLNRQGSEDYDKYLLSLGEPSPKYVGKDITLYGYENESELLIGFTNFIREHNPNLITGYNILGFDIPYMIDRAKLNLCISEFDRQGFPVYRHAKEKTIKWSSSAYKNQEFQFLDTEGRVFVDLLPIVRRDYKLNNYKLKTVSEHFLEDDTKDPLTAQDIFRCYEIGTIKRADGTYSKKAIKAISEVGKYCVQDTALCNKLMDKLDIWTGLAEMAKVCNVNVFDLYTKGQQVKVFSQVYHFCMYNNIVVEKDGYVTKENERYVGAHVFDPIPGVYDKVVPFDFASLYPTTMIAYNIDYSTLVDDSIDNKIRDSQCHVMDWTDHVGCIHDPKVIRKMEIDAHIDAQKEKIKKLRIKRDSIRGKNTKEKKQVYQKQIDEITKSYKPIQEERTDIMKSKPKNIMCEKRYYRFLKEPKGVIPTVLEDLLQARKSTRKQIKQNKEIIKNSKDKKIIKDLTLLNRVLHQRQLSYKVSCNSMYGAMGVKRGYLPFMPGAMSTTYMGRINIEKVAEVIPKEFGGKLIYGDTDSNYIQFPHLNSPEEIWNYAENVAEQVTCLFRKPIRLDFEEAIYWRFLILTKKRYMYTSWTMEGGFNNSVGKKGVLLARRDNSPFIRNIYEKTVDMIFNYKDKDEVLYYILTEMNNLCGRYFPMKDFVVTKSVGDTNNLLTEPFYDEESGKMKIKMGDYTLPLLPPESDEDARYKQLDKKEAKTAEEYYLKCLPAQVQLAEKMKRRGTRVDSGSRLEYVILDTGNMKDKQYDKVEDVAYYKKHKNVLNLDYMYYMKLLSNPMDQVIKTAFGDRKFMTGHYKVRVNRNKMLKEFKELLEPKLVFEE